MEISVTRASLALLIVIVCSVDARNYLAFPRMGRSGYLAFPRMGRSQVKSGSSDAECCRMGLKTEFLIGQDGKQDMIAVCSSSVCCEGLREIIGEKPDGVIYSMCVPDFSMPAESAGPSSATLSKLKTLLQN